MAVPTRFELRPMVRSHEPTAGLLALLGLGPPPWWHAFAAGLLALLIAATVGLAAVLGGIL